MDFGTLDMRPLYKKGTEDIGEDSIVAVGYTVGTWPLVNPVNLSLNLQFVIVIA